MALLLLFQNGVILGVALVLVESYERSHSPSGTWVSWGRCLSLSINLAMYIFNISFRVQCLILAVLVGLLPEQLTKRFPTGESAKSWKDTGLAVTRLLLGVYTSHWTQQLLNNKGQSLLAVTAIYFALQVITRLSAIRNRQLVSAALLLLALLLLQILNNPLFYLLLFLLINLIVRVNEPRNSSTNFFEVMLGFAVLGRLEGGAEWRSWTSSWAMGLGSLML